MKIVKRYVLPNLVPLAVSSLWGAVVVSLDISLLQQAIVIGMGTLLIFGANFFNSQAYKNQ